MKNKAIHRKSALTIRQRAHAVNRIARAVDRAPVNLSPLALVALIEKNIPPPTFRTNGKGIADVLRALKINDSVLLPINRNHARVAAHRVIGSGNYAVRREGEGARVWRIK